MTLRTYLIIEGERETDRTSRRPTAMSKEKYALKRTFIYLVLHGTIISATCCATILYLSLLALALIGICNSLFEPLFFSRFLFLSLSPLTACRTDRCQNSAYHSSVHDQLHWQRDTVHSSPSRHCLEKTSLVFR